MTPSFTVSISTILLRHGETPLSGQRYSGRGDPGLTGRGREQAAAAASRLAREPGLAAVISSPLSRARDTAEAVAAAAGVPLCLEDDLVETDFGCFEGLTFEEAQERWRDDHTAWLDRSFTEAPPGGESVADVARRVSRALARLRTEYAGETVVLVSHVTPIKLMVCSALGVAAEDSFFRLRIDTGGLTRIDWYGADSAVVAWVNDTSHLRRTVG
ncbi:histidine phosphatase family protein [Amycolatopsis sp. MtRt-6]|uniref:histidine phosphatase family protein n=1 Tax=Amycolatopsis sp. MtRt-6 TaxID=2792782 RepID=UPI001A90BE11|nr:histidine phosphatase family protein [Amycolatopsis sp. MtRt-6]